MAKYKVGDKFISKRNGEGVKVTILFVPPVDGYDEQYYLEEVYSKYANGGDKMFLSLAKEKSIDDNFVLR